MDFQLKTLSIAQAAAEKCDVLIVLVASGTLSAKDALSTLIADARKATDLPDKAGKLLALYRPAGITAPRVVLASVGDGKPSSVRSTVIAAINAAKGTNPKRVAIVFAQLADAAGVGGAVIAAADASYVFTTTKPKAEARTIRHADRRRAGCRTLRQAFDEATATVAGIELAKEWGNRPGNYCTPTLLADAAKDLAKLPNIKCEVLGPKEVAKLGMGSFSAVAQGSAQPLRFIVLRYQGAPKDQAPVVLVGKGITFDTGGVSLKPAAEMDEMKFDMCGAASVLGVFRALGDIQPAINVIGLVPSCENMNDGGAVKPGDVVTSMSGQTIEVLNTDAEGRLILCDALTYAKRFAPAAVIDIATLTGACVVALGGIRSGLFSSDDALAGALAAAGEEVAGSLLAPAAGRRLCRGPEEQLRRCRQHRRPRGRCDHGRQVPAALRERFPVGAPRRRGHCMEERGGQGRHRPPGRPAAELSARPKSATGAPSRPHARPRRHGPRRD